MAFTPLSGKSAVVKIGATSYSFGKWSLNMRAKLPEVSNFNGAGYRNRVAGLVDATLTIEGPYDNTNMSFTVGNSYTWILGFSAAVTITCTAYISSIEPSSDVDDAGRVKITADTDGSFTAAIV